MKTRFAFLAVLVTLTLLCLFPPPAKADVGSVNMLSAGTITNSTTRTTGFTDVKVEDQENVSLQVEYQGDQAGTGAMTLIIARSKNGTTFETTPRQTIGFALNGNTAVVGFTNLTQVGAAHTLRLISVANADASASATNCTISVVKKRVSVK